MRIRHLILVSKHWCHCYTINSVTWTLNISVIATPLILVVLLLHLMHYTLLLKRSTTGMYCIDVYYHVKIMHNLYMYYKVYTCLKVTMITHTYNRSPKSTVNNVPSALISSWHFPSKSTNLSRSFSELCVTYIHSEWTSD